MIKNIYCLSIVLAILLCSCQPKTNKKFDLVEKGLNNATSGHFKESFKTLIIIPNEGCSGCISTTTSFIKESIDTLKSNVIFTGIQDFKVLKAKIGEKLLKSPKVYFDKKNDLMHRDIASIYPQVVFFDDDNNIVSIKDFDISLFKK